MRPRQMSVLYLSFSLYTRYCKVAVLCRMVQSSLLMITWRVAVSPVHTRPPILRRSRVLGSSS